MAMNKHVTAYNLRYIIQQSLCVYTCDSMVDVFSRFKLATNIFYFRLNFYISTSERENDQHLFPGKNQFNTNPKDLVTTFHYFFFYLSTNRIFTLLFHLENIARLASLMSQELSKTVRQEALFTV